MLIFYAKYARIVYYYISCLVTVVCSHTFATEIKPERFFTNNLKRNIKTYYEKEE